MIRRASELAIGLDVGSTTVKAVVVEPGERRVLWRAYERHETRQAEKSLELFERMEADLGPAAAEASVWVTGSGGGTIGKVLGARFVQEVNAVVLAARRLHPDARSIVELGGQDAKIVVFREDPKTGAITSIPSMNDKCASGTGATIEKIARKVGVDPAELAERRYLPYVDRLVHVAAKCGVFAETDVVGHLKAGLPEETILASLFDSIVSQNLSVLTRGHTLRPTVLLLGGPNAFLPGLVEAWRHHVPRTWEERGVAVPEDVPVEELIVVPADALYFAALGAAEFGIDTPEAALERRGTVALSRYIEEERAAGKAQAGGQGLWSDEAELAAFREAYRPAVFEPARFAPGERVVAALGIDGGSTSTKAALLGDDGRVLAKAYVLSDGNPIQDAMDCVASLRAGVEADGATLEIAAVGTTGYAKDVLAEVLGADAAVVETVAHTMAARRLRPDVDVIVDVGGQDIKIIVLQDGRVADFRLNTQCSAGNGYFLQSTAKAFGIPIERFAESAFRARRMPIFGYGCAVFMQSDIVDFQREGWTPDEIMAGLAAVLPKNVWLYVSKIPNLASLGRTFVLQGGTQHNLAAVKAQVDFIRTRFEGKGVEPVVLVHDHCGEAGAIGAAMEAGRVVAGRRGSSFVGLEGATSIVYRKTSDERTRCTFCKNNCTRTFVDVETEEPAGPAYASAVPLEPGWRRIVTGFSCDRGTVESVEAMKVIKESMDRGLERTPNTVDWMAKAAFRAPEVEPAIPPRRRWGGRRAEAEILAAREWRAGVRIGIPRALNLYSHAPFFLGYFAALGIPHANVVFSQSTSETMYREGAKRGAIDPCFPSKVAVAHVHDLLARIHARKPLSFLFFPMIDAFPSPLHGVNASRACPTVAATPEAVKAAFTTEDDVFAERGLPYVNPLVPLDDPPLLAARLMEALGERLRLDPVENRLAVREGLRALAAFDAQARRRGREAIDALAGEGRVGIVVLARPYHGDEGINHEILLKLQRMGYPILAQDSLPTDAEFLDPLFEGEATDPLSIGDVWAAAYSENTSRKLWAAKVVARHPNLVALELSSFKCGHDATCYAAIERILAASRTPFFTFRDLDENDPGGAINLRLETIDYFLKRERERLAGGESTGGDPAAGLELADAPFSASLTGGKACASPEPDRAPARAPDSGLLQIEIPAPA